MEKFTCLQKARDPKTNAIMSYQLQDEYGNTSYVMPVKLKQAIYNGEVIVENLKLTSDGRLIDCKPEEQLKAGDIVSSSNWEISKYIANEIHRKFSLMRHKANYIQTRDYFGTNNTNTKLGFETADGIKQLPSALLYIDCRYINKLNTLSEGAVETNEFCILAIGVDAEQKKEYNTANELIDVTVYFGWTHGEVGSQVIQTQATKQLSNTINARLDKWELMAYAGKVKQVQDNVKDLATFLGVLIASYIIPKEDFNLILKSSKKAEDKLVLAQLNGEQTDPLIINHMKKVEESASLADKDGVVKDTIKSKQNKGLFNMFKR